MSDELRKKLRCLIVLHITSSGHTVDELADAAIALIRAETLEEAVKAAESVKTVEIDGYDFQVDGPSQYTIAAAIRALKGAL